MCSWSSADAPTTSELSTILLPTKMRLILEVLRKLRHVIIFFIPVTPTKFKILCSNMNSIDTRFPSEWRWLEHYKLMKLYHLTNGHPRSEIPIGWFIGEKIQRLYCSLSWHPLVIACTRFFQGLVNYELFFSSFFSFLYEHYSVANLAHSLSHSCRGPDWRYQGSLWPHHPRCVHHRS